jgi:hypothetical protein
MSEQAQQTGRLLTIATWVSAFALSVAIFLFGASWWLNPLDHRLSFGEHLHFGICRMGYHDPRLVVFNDPQYGPYSGSIIAIVGDDGNVKPPLKESAFGDVAGVYYRHFAWVDSGNTLWTLMVSLWYPIGLFAILPARSVFRLLLSGGRSTSTPVTPSALHG